DCSPKTQASQSTVAKSGKAIACLKVSIQRPGLGSSAASRGTNESVRYGSAIPTASALNTGRATTAGCVSAKPRAAPMNGAVQGVATTVASTPEKKLPA